MARWPVPVDRPLWHRRLGPPSLPICRQGGRPPSPRTTCVTEQVPEKGPPQEDGRRFPCVPGAKTSFMVPLRRQTGKRCSYSRPFASRQTQLTLGGGSGGPGEKCHSAKGIWGSQKHACPLAAATPVQSRLRRREGSRARPKCDSRALGAPDLDWTGSN